MISNKKIAALVLGVVLYGIAHISSFSQAITAGQPVSQVASAGAESNLATKFSSCKDYFPNSAPLMLDSVPSDTTKELCFDDFAVLYSTKTKTPVFAVEKLNRERLIAAKEEQRTNKFYEEARLPRRDRAMLTDYRGSGFDRGHNAPAGDRSTDEAMAQSFSLANMVPQDPEHNRKTWASIEKATRKYVMRASGDVFVFTGPYYDPSKEPRTIGDGVQVPDVMWKVVYDSTNGKTFVYWSENEAGVRVQAPIGYDEFKSRTGLDLIITGIR